MIPSPLQPLANHLWQSTLFAGAAGLLTLALRRNRAQIRYWLWLAASVKFLLPFSILVDAGSHFARHSPGAMVQSSLSSVIEQVSQPFAASVPLAANPAAQPSSASLVAAILCAAWAIGFVALVSRWWLRWRGICAALRTASPVQLPIDMEAMTSAAFAEPGVFGVRRPVLLLPAGLIGHLTPPQLEAILTHELCHVRRRDNIATAIHMAVEAVFWFHPLVWWLGARLMEERERACDEEVLRMGSEPHVYAEGILKICELYLEPTLPCVAGVRGGNLKKRIEEIMSNRIVLRLNFTKKLGLAAAGVAALVVPIVVGIMNVPSVRAQAPSAQAVAGSPVAFQVASVKPSDPRAGGGDFKSQDPTVRGPAFQVESRRLTITSLNLFALIVHAYGVRGCRPFGGGSCVLLSGGPDWLRKDGFDILAKMPDDSPDYTLTLTQFQNGQAPQVQLMLQALLADRFHLKLHREKKQVPVFALTVGKKGPRLKKAEESEQPMLAFRPSVQSNGPGIIQLVVRNSSMQELTDFYSKFMDRPVLDETGLKDRFDFTMDYEANADAPGPFTAATGPGLFKAFQDQAGLKLEATKGSVEVLVIDHAEHPTEN